LHGEVSPPNLVAAREWLTRAAANGVAEAKQAIEDLPEVGAVTQPSKQGIAYQQGMGNLEQSWQGYADMIKVLHDVDAKAAAGI